MKNIKSLGISLAVASILFSGCGGGGGSSTSSTVDTQTGTFVDAPVQGLNYSTATQSGVTDSSGQFKYISGETVEFKLGTLSLGSIAANESINPLDLARDTGLGSVSTKAQNIAMLLQNLDQNRSNTGTIIISSALREHNFSNLDLTSGTLEASMNALLADASISGNIDQINNTVITQANANTTMVNYLKGYITGNYQGKFTLSKQIVSSSLFVCANSGAISMALTQNGNNFNASTIFEILPNTSSSTLTYVINNLSNFTATRTASGYDLTISNTKVNGKNIRGNYKVTHNNIDYCSGTYIVSK